MDLNLDGVIDFNEFTEAIGNSTNSKAIVDPKHWAFEIFESIRRALIN